MILNMMKQLYTVCFSHTGTLGQGVSKLNAEFFVSENQ